MDTELRVKVLETQQGRPIGACDEEQEVLFLFIGTLSKVIPELLNVRIALLKAMVDRVPSQVINVDLVLATRDEEL